MYLPTMSLGETSAAEGNMPFGYLVEELLVSLRLELFPGVPVRLDQLFLNDVLLVLSHEVSQRNLALGVPENCLDPADGRDRHRDPGILASAQSQFVGVQAMIFLQAPGSGPRQLFHRVHIDGQV